MNHHDVYCNVTIEGSHAALAEASRAECARLLRACAAAIEAGETSSPIRDANGNWVGHLTFSCTAEEDP